MCGKFLTAPRQPLNTNQRILLATSTILFCPVRGACAPGYRGEYYEFIWRQVETRSPAESYYTHILQRQYFVTCILKFAKLKSHNTRPAPVRIMSRERSGALSPVIAIPNGLVMIPWRSSSKGLPVMFCITMPRRINACPIARQQRKPIFEKIGKEFCKQPVSSKVYVFTVYELTSAAARINSTHITHRHVRLVQNKKPSLIQQLLIQRNMSNVYPQPHKHYYT